MAGNGRADGGSGKVRAPPHGGRPRLPPHGGRPRTPPHTPPPTRPQARARPRTRCLQTAVTSWKARWRGTTAPSWPTARRARARRTRSSWAGGRGGWLGRGRRRRGRMQDGGPRQRLMRPAWRAAERAGCAHAPDNASHTTCRPRAGRGVGPAAARHRASRGRGARRGHRRRHQWRGVRRAPRCPGVMPCSRRAPCSRWRALRSSRPARPPLDPNAPSPRCASPSLRSTAIACATFWTPWAVTTSPSSRPATAAPSSRVRMAAGGARQAGGALRLLLGSCMRAHGRATRLAMHSARVPASCMRAHVLPPGHRAPARRN
jgi:hypothetical protein